MRNPRLIAHEYCDGLFLPVPGATGTFLDRAAQAAKVVEIFLDLICRFTKENRSLSSNASRSYAPAVFAREEEAKAAGDQW